MTASILFAHGAGAPSTSEWMLGWTRRLQTLTRVVSFDYPYMAAGRKRPDRLPKLIEAHREALRSLAGSSPDGVILAGKSMGSRVGCHLSLEEPVEKLICFGYPLVGINGKRRDEVLLALRTPILFVQGTRDRLCPLEVLEEVRGRMSAESSLFVVETGDHSLRITKTHTKQTGNTQEHWDQQVLEAIRAFVGP